MIATRFNDTADIPYNNRPQGTETYDVIYINNYQDEIEFIEKNETKENIKYLCGRKMLIKNPYVKKYRLFNRYLSGVPP